MINGTQLRPEGRTISRKVMIDLLVAEGYTWAGWYCEVCLAAKYVRVFGGFMRSSR